MSYAQATGSFTQHPSNTQKTNAQKYYMQRAVLISKNTQQNQMS